MIHRSRAALLVALVVLPAVARAQDAATTPAITSQEIASRRDSLAARIGDGVVIAFGGRTPVTDFGPFYQLPGFHYLTGYDEADAALVLVARACRPTATLFTAPIDPRVAMYYGRRADSATIARTLGIAARPIATLDATVDSLVATGAPVYQLTDVADADFARQDSVTRGQLYLRTLASRHPGLVVRNAAPLVDALRARKSAAEVALLRRAAQISSAGHRAAMLLPNPRHEYELQAELEHEFLRLGGARPAYGSIVGAAVNGTQLHYMKDRAEVHPGDVVVMDAATEYEGYAADVTRTIPVSGRFTPEQRTIYQLVRDAQAAAERNSKPGMRAAAAQDSSERVRAEGLAKLGLVASADATFDPPWNANCQTTPRMCRQAMLWMIHGISHGLGLAVHDPAQFYSSGVFSVGDAFTIEPGIYINEASLAILPDTPKNRAFVAKVRDAVRRYQNTGVRIEDDYVITQAGLERISDAPRELDEVEALMRERGVKTVP